MMRQLRFAILVGFAWSASACSVPRSGLGPEDAGQSSVPDGGMDALPPNWCVTADDCDDDVPCTLNTCESGRCRVTTDDSVCDLAPAGRCDPVFGCQYDTCNTDTCTPGPCEAARCEGAICIRERICGDDEMCCGDACVPSGCDDGNPCTDDACGAAGCENVPNAAACDDGNFCNGPDTCADGTCDLHAGDPCSDPTVCNEDQGLCVGCNADTDCPAPMMSPFSTCRFTGGFCDETGTQERTVTTFSCVDNRCVSTSEVRTRSCSRDREGEICGDVTIPGFGDCTEFSDVCDTTGVRRRTITENVCRSEACATEMTVEEQGCGRITDGMACQDGNRCTTGDTCNGGTCETGTPVVCDDGNACTDDSCDPANGACRSVNHTRACNDGDRCTTNDRCGGGACTGTAISCPNDGNPCTNDVCNPADGTCGVPRTGSCNDGNPCTSGDTCTGGTCSGMVRSCPSDGDPCTDDVCNPADGTCGIDNTASCDDGNECTEEDTCSGGACEGSPIVCVDDGDPCTVEACDPDVGCVAEPVSCAGACEGGCPGMQECLCTGGSSVCGCAVP